MAECITVTIGDQTLTIRLPGGVTLQPMIESSLPTNFQIVKNLLSQASAALAPLAPIFKILDAVLAIKDFAEAVPDVITNPASLIEAIVELIKKIAALASLIPQLSIPIMIVDLIDVVIVALQGIVEEIEFIATKLEEIETARALAQSQGNAALLEVTVCADDLMASIQANASNALGPLNTLFNVLNLFLGLIGQDPIPSMDDLSDDPEEAIDALNNVVTVLQNIRNVIPVP